jgi:hypothetical protein
MHFEKDDCDALFGDDDDDDLNAAQGAFIDGDASTPSSTQDIRTRPSSALAHISQAGYRAGVQAMQDLRLQEGFDAGFEAGGAVGEELGVVYARCRIAFARALTASSIGTPSQLQPEASSRDTSPCMSLEQRRECLERIEEILFKAMTMQRADELKHEVLELAKNFNVY